MLVCDLGWLYNMRIAMFEFKSYMLMAGYSHCTLPGTLPVPDTVLGMYIVQAL
jgi:hypothetical protein